MDANSARRADLVKARWKYVCFLDSSGHEVLEIFDPEIIHSAYAASEGIPRDRYLELAGRFDPPYSDGEESDEPAVSSVGL